MTWSKRKPYHHLKLSMKEFFSRPVRYLKEFYGKESVMDKPYLVGRPEMHHDVPEYPGLAPWTRPRLPEIPGLPGLPSLPPIPGFSAFPSLPRIPDFPSFKLPEFRFEQPGVASPWVRPEEPMGTPPGRRPGEPAVKPLGLVVAPQCDISGYIDCLDQGDVGYFNAAGYRKDAVWGVEVSDPDLVSAKIIRLNAEGLPKSGSLAGMIKIQVTGLADPDIEWIVTVCVFMATYATTGYRSVPYPRGSGHDTTYKKKIANKRMDVAHCGCINITVPCECGGDADELTWNDAGSNDTIVREGSATVAVLGGTGPYSWSVSGTGFTLSNAITVGQSNTLNADNTACGTAEITVIDKCGQTVTGHVREIGNSHWQRIGADDDKCVISGAASWVKYGAQAYKFDGTLIRGNKKAVVHIGGAFCLGSCATPNCLGRPDSCAGHTSCSEWCSSGGVGGCVNCSECLTGFTPSGAFTNKMGAWNCWGATGTECGDGGYSQTLCACNINIRNYDWICD